MTGQCSYCDLQNPENVGVCLAKHFHLERLEEVDGYLQMSVELASQCLECPITGSVMVNPVMTADGHVYEKDAIERWFQQGRSTSPLTNLALSSLHLVPLLPLQCILGSFLKHRPELSRYLMIQTTELKEALADTRRQLAAAKMEIEVIRSEREIAFKEIVTGAYKQYAGTKMDAEIQHSENEVSYEQNANCQQVKRRKSKVVWRRRCRRTKTHVNGAHFHANDILLGSLPPPPSEVPGIIPSAREDARDVALSKVRRTLDQAINIDTQGELEPLLIMKDELSVALQDARQHGIPEVDLIEAERQRRRLHNVIEDRKGSIRVFCRFRPMSEKEFQQGDKKVITPIDSMSVRHCDQVYAFDAVFHPAAQEEVFADCFDLIQSALDGYNVTIFAYGQTGAGKTYTMFGCPGKPGLAPRIIQNIYRLTNRNKDRFSFSLSASMIELYRNSLVDLLHKGSGSTLATKPPVVRTDRHGEVRIENVLEQTCTDSHELEALLSSGHQNRAVAATAMNSESSRSHLILSIKISSANKETNEVSLGKILLVDLAGSERLKKSQVTGDMQKEAIEINKSLTALGDVMEALTKNHKQVPYRNHKLTQVMQDSLGGSAKTLMFVNCSPAESNQEETRMSLKYASRAKKIMRHETQASL
eukprot:gnl/MRDRNA2_/MRDRNA2_27903_c0_seq1.p1 gnl/MRDRNA2_/MRDRNA2_27903_c0~~gnl/MRDRNA2_/MRDRNA2_27903_c0_seq1.p1  ORF type:complete len:646 (-),score=110.21 gnl/MRDRNA2_/MRDRNA2_27903_c0_seq1:188-2125(-)